jgi:uncharacterized protein
MNARRVKKALLSYTKHELLEASKHLAEPLPASWLTELLAIDEGGDEIIARGDGFFEGSLAPSGDEHFLLRGEVRAPLSMPCGRCLGPANVDIQADMTILFAPAKPGRKVKGRTSADSEGEFEFDPSEAEMTFFEGDHVILDDVIREAIVLEIPISALCSEACPGINPTPVNLLDAPSHAIDPRLAQLAKFTDRLKK